MKLPPGFTKKEFQETSDEYLKGLFGIKDTKKTDKKGANKAKQRAKPDCACDDVTDKKELPYEKECSLETSFERGNRN